ncbi:MAG: BMP family ABC transporter substrate-binding protein [Clostridia bacterium]
MKKTVAFLIIILMMLSFGSCGKSHATAVAFVYGTDGILDRGANQGVSAALEKYCTEKERTYLSCQAATDDKAGFNAAVAQAVKKGAALIAVEGEANAPFVTEWQAAYPKTSFLIIDATIKDMAANTRSITFKGEEAGFLAGFSLVMEGYTKIEFMGVSENTMTKQFGYGFLRGADLAAITKNIDVQMRYSYVGTIDKNDEIKKKAATGFINGTEIIFFCGGNIYKPIIFSANEAKGKTAGAYIDQAGESESVVTSAVFDYTTIIGGELLKFFENGGKWDSTQSGKSSVFGIAEKAVYLPTYKGGFRFKTFTVTEYEKLVADILGGLKTINGSISQFPTMTKVKIIDDTVKSEK